MKRKLMLFTAALLSALWSQTGLATCSVYPSTDTSTFSGYAYLNQHRAGEVLSTRVNPSSFIVECDRSGGWFELTPAKAFSPSPLGNGIITTNIDFVGVSITADLLNEDTNGNTRTLLTDGSFTSRRWVIPATEDSQPKRRFNAMTTKNFTIWAIGPEDPKPGIFDTAPYFTLTTDDGIATPVLRFTNTARMIASCVPTTTMREQMTISMPDVYTNEFPSPGKHFRTRTHSYSYSCDRDINVRFTFTPTNTVPGFPNLLAPEPGGPEGVGIMLQYRTVDNQTRTTLEQGDITLGEPYDVLGGPVNHVSRSQFDLSPYYYRYGNTEVTSGHFRTTATMNIQFQ